MLKSAPLFKIKKELRTRWSLEKRKKMEHKRPIQTGDYFERRKGENQEFRGHYYHVQLVNKETDEIVLVHPNGRVNVLPESLVRDEFHHLSHLSTEQWRELKLIQFITEADKTCYQLLNGSQPISHRYERAVTGTVFDLPTACARTLLVAAMETLHSVEDLCLFIDEVEASQFSGVKFTLLPQELGVSTLDLNGPFIESLGLPIQTICQAAGLNYSIRYDSNAPTNVLEVQIASCHRLASFISLEDLRAITDIAYEVFTRRGMKLKALSHDQLGVLSQQPVADLLWLFKSGSRYPDYWPSRRNEDVRASAAIQKQLRAISWEWQVFFCHLCLGYPAEVALNQVNPTF